MAEKDDLDAARVDAQPVHVGQEGRAAIEEDAVVDDNTTVIALQ